MGSEVRRAAGATDDLEVIGGVDLGGQREQIAAAQVAVDFTHPDAVMGNIEWCVPRGISMVIGTTGFTQERIARVRELCSASPGTGVLVASVCGSLTNTVFYLGLMLLFYTLLGLNAGVVLGVIAGAGALNGSCEAVAAALLCTPIVLGVRRAFGDTRG